MSIVAQAHQSIVGSAGSRRDHAAATDLELIARIAASDTQAMRVLVARYSVRVFRYVLRMVKDRTLAEDLVNETFFDVWRQAHQFEARAKVSTWLLTISRYKAISGLRHRRVHGSLDEAHDVPDLTENAEVAWCKADRAKVIRSCLMKLTASHREVLDLVYYHEEPIESVAKIIGIPLNTVKTRLFYARKHLAALLADVGIVEVGDSRG
jgi:RNA polymerase sigma-70 factor (ECF subfamily)